MRDYEFYYTQDGSVGLYSYEDNDVYHSKFGALSEAWEKFIIPSGIEEKINNTPNINILDVCYGIGYNTKSLLSFIVNKNEKIFYKKNLISKIKKFFFKNKNIDTIDNNNISEEEKWLLEYIDTNKLDCLTKYRVDCLDINSDLIKLSPLLKTIITPQDVFVKIIPKIFDCFDTYWKIKKYLTKISLNFAPKNNKHISELLNLKFKNDYKIINEDYKIHNFINYILVDELDKKFKKDYLTKNFNNLISEKDIKKFLAPDLVKYLKIKQNFIYKIFNLFDITTFLHNIYYNTLSRRDIYEKYLVYKHLFSVNFYNDDARKTILTLDKKYDYIFLDAFTFSKAPELWSVEFIAELYEKLAPDGLLLTYSSSALVRNTLLENNFYLGKIYDKSSDKYIGTVAAKNKSLIKYPLSNHELGLCATKAGIPYRDPGLNRTKEDILKYREYEFKTSDLVTSSQYIKSRLRSAQDDEEEEGFND